MFSPRCKARPSGRKKFHSSIACVCCPYTLTGSYKKSEETKWSPLYAKDEPFANIIFTSRKIHPYPIWWKGFFLPLEKSNPLSNKKIVQTLPLSGREKKEKEVLWAQENVIDQSASGFSFRCDLSETGREFPWLARELSNGQCRSESLPSLSR